MPDWIPGGDLPASQFFTTNATYASANAPALGVGTTRATAYLDAAGVYQNALADHDAKQDQARAATILKDQARAAVELLAREVGGLVQGNPAVSDQQRLAGGWPVRDTTKTPVPPPSETPVITVDTGDRLRHTLRFGFGAGRGRAKPPGTTGYGVWAAVGSATPPSDLAQCTFLGIASRGTFSLTYPGADGGKTVWYIAACLNAKGERGPLSETVAATVAA